MRIGCVLDSVSSLAAGVSESARALSRELATSNVVEAFGIEDEQTNGLEESWSPVSVHLLPRLGPPAFGYSSHFLPAMLAANLDVVLGHGLWKYSSLASHRWHRITGRPYIIHPHGMLDPWAVRNAQWKKRLAYIAYERAHLANAACLRALNEEEAGAIRDFGLRNPICVIPNGVDLPELSTNHAAPWNADESRKVLLYLGRLHPKKNLPALLEAWKTTGATSSDKQEWRLVIAGWDQNNHEAELKQQARALGIEGSVHFAGPLFGAEKTAAYQHADAFILPSLSEGLPMVVLEAWAQAKPVVMTPECNLPEGFAAGAALSTGKTADAIAETLRDLFEMDDAERKAMGERGRALVSKKFLWPKIAEEMKSVCDWAVGGGDPPACVRCD
jgi:glycosyltransferase involved in cell wall biosynthesis